MRMFAGAVHPGSGVSVELLVKTFVDHTVCNERNENCRRIIRGYNSAPLAPITAKTALKSNPTTAPTSANARAAFAAATARV